MDYATFKQAVSDAERIMQETDAADFVTNTDSIITMCYLELLLKTQKPATVEVHQKITTTALPPDWFTETLSQMPETRVTSSMVFKAARRIPSMSDLRLAGAWLRGLYGEPKRSNGQILFVVKAEPPKETYGSEDHLPLSARAARFISTNRGTFTIDQIMEVLGVDFTRENRLSIQSELIKYKVPCTGSHWQVGLR